MGEYTLSASESRPAWQELARNHRRQQHDNIPKEWLISNEVLTKLGCKTTGVDLVVSEVVAKTKLLSETELDITEEYTAVELLEKMAAGHFTSLQVTTAFCKRAALAHQMTNCLTEIFFTDALKRAEELDAYYKSTGSVKGPLHGLPISLKDALIVSGKYATVGYTEFLRQPPPTQDSALVSQLLDAGAVLYCKTNVPQTMMSADSENNVFGRTVNPRNIALTAGGSTGGEGALLALRGSPLGIGSDIAGSIRIPSLCCGTYGFKPTADRVAPSGQSESPFPRLWIPGVVPPVTGPMGNSVGDLEAFMRIATTQSPWKHDHAAIYAPWNATNLQTSPHPLRIGVLPEDTEYNLHPPVKRALNEAVTLLRDAGHTLIALPEDPTRSIGLGARLAFYSYGIGAPSHQEFMAKLGEPLVMSIGRGVHPFTNNPPLATGTDDLGEKLHKFAVARDQYSDSWRRTWVQHDLDVVLAPGAQSTAVPHDQYGVPAYTCAWNVPDFPACIIPFGAASKKRDPDAVFATAAFDPDYDPEALDGAPCAVQIIAPRFHDELCLSATKIIDAVLNPEKPAR